MVLVGAFWLVEKSSISSGEFSISYSRAVLLQALLIGPFVSYIIRDWNYGLISSILERLWIIGLLIVLLAFYEGFTYLWELLISIVAGVSVLVESAELRNSNKWKKNWIILAGISWRALIYISFIYNQSLQLYVLTGGTLIFVYSLFKIKINAQEITRPRSSYLLLIIFSLGAFRTYIDKWFVYHDLSKDLLAGYIMNSQLAQSAPMLAMSILSMKFTTSLYVAKDGNEQTARILNRTLIAFIGLSLSGLVLILFLNSVIFSVINEVSLFLVLYANGVMFFGSQILGTELIAKYKLRSLLIYNISLSFVPFVFFMIFSVTTIMQVAWISLCSSLICLMLVQVGRNFKNG